MGADQNTQSLSIYLYSLPQICLNNTDARSVIDYFFPQPSTKCASTLVLSSYFSLNLTFLLFNLFPLCCPSFLLFDVIIIVSTFFETKFTLQLIIAEVCFVNLQLYWFLSPSLSLVLYCHRKRCNINGKQCI